MSVIKGLILGALITISNADYIKNTILGCNGNVYWNFGLSTKNVISLKNTENNENMCREACNNNDKCNAWGINVNNNDICNLFTFVDSGLIYNCEANDVTIYYGEIKECLINKDLTMSVIAGFNNEKNAVKFVYDTESQCYQKKYSKGNIGLMKSSGLSSQLKGSKTALRLFGKERRLGSSDSGDSSSNGGNGGDSSSNGGNGDSSSNGNGGDSSSSGNGGDSSSNNGAGVGLSPPVGWSTPQSDPIPPTSRPTPRPSVWSIPQSDPVPPTSRPTPRPSVWSIPQSDPVPPTSSPTNTPTDRPTYAPTYNPTARPTYRPTPRPSVWSIPQSDPIPPTARPTYRPTYRPTPRPVGWSAQTDSTNNDVMTVNNNNNNNNDFVNNYYYYILYVGIGALIIGFILGVFVVAACNIFNCSCKRNRKGYSPVDKQLQSTSEFTEQAVSEVTDNQIADNPVPDNPQIIKQ